MLVVRLAERRGRPAAVVVPVRASEVAEAEAEDTTPGTPAVDPDVLPDYLAAVTEEFLAETEHTGTAGTTQQLPLAGRVAYGRRRRGPGCDEQAHRRGAAARRDRARRGGSTHRRAAAGGVPASVG